MTISHSLLQMLPDDNPKKLELCKRVIDTIALIDPYGSRLAIHQAIALHVLSTYPGQDKHDLSLKAIQLLRYEPPGSAGDLLSRVILAGV